MNVYKVELKFCYTMETTYVVAPSFGKAELVINHQRRHGYEIVSVERLGECDVYSSLYEPEKPAVNK